MRNIKEIPSHVFRSGAALSSQADLLSEELDSKGLIILPDLIKADQLARMQRAFGARLKRMRWNHFDGYRKTEPFRLMVEDVLMLDQGFMDVALHPLIKGILNRLMGASYALTEAKGWRSKPTKRDFHGWHADSWYDQAPATEIHREIKVAVYLTDVRSGAFNYLVGTNQRRHPHDLKRAEVSELPLDDVIEVKGKAGTVFMFDSSGTHRQAHPVIEPREAIFYAYHDPATPLREEDVVSYRYHPLLLNAAFLGNLDAEDQRILGFGDKTNFQPAYQRSDRPPLSYHAMCVWNDAHIRLGQARERNVNRAKFLLRLLRRK
jgi:Phytanoyl-CoA dioxygenase (PhyH)